jgi:acyl-CoA synthetase (AMP-forming)/AMP-acid ligase II
MYLKGAWVSLVPETIFVADPVVLFSGTGKILRKELREWAKAEIVEKEKRARMGARL